MYLKSTTGPGFLISMSAGSTSILSQTIDQVGGRNLNVVPSSYMCLLFADITRTTIWSFLRLFENPSRLISSMSSGPGLPVKGRNSGFFLWGISQGL